MINTCSDCGQVIGVICFSCRDKDMEEKKDLSKPQPFINYEQHHKNYSAGIAEELEDIRKKRPTGEPARSDKEEIRELVKQNKKMGKQLSDYNAVIGSQEHKIEELESRLNEDSQNFQIQCHQEEIALLRKQLEELGYKKLPS